MYLKHLDEDPRVIALVESKDSHEFRGALLKRAFDVAFSVAGLIVALPILAALVVLNPFFNPGPIFFRQERMGWKGERFHLWKFRTMVPCERGLPERPPTAPLDSHRVTRLGAVLRKTHLDEFPNFWNVLRGDMSVVGPRPDAWSHATHFALTVPRYRERFRVRPGITGLAQVRGGYADCESSVRRKARLDSIYARAPSLRVELYVLWETVKRVLFGVGAG